jgi:5,10-methylene-tetrahydrofolate dehydrogenase/methenyl tetrahydrofolate cyclohydrolase
MSAHVMDGTAVAARLLEQVTVGTTGFARMESRYVELPASTTTGELATEIRTLSEDPAVDGILLQHPVPAHVDERAAFEAIAPIKDVDGVTMHSFAADGVRRARRCGSGRRIQPR